MRLLIVLAVSWGLVGCAMSIEEVRNASETELVSMVREGYFDNGCPLDPIGKSLAKAELFCELVYQDRRKLVEETLRVSPRTLTCMPLLACSPSGEAYHHWKARGAPLQLEGLLTNGRDIRGLPGQSLQVAVGNAKPEVVALHLLDGADARKRSGYASSPLGEALQAWHLHATQAERDGYLPGMVHLYGVTGYVGNPVTVRVRRGDAAPSLEIVRMLIESGADLDDLVDTSAMGELGVGYPGWYTSGITYRKQYSPLRPELAAAERQAREVRQSLADCRNRKQRPACEQVLARATSFSPVRALAQQQIAQIDQEQGDWSNVLAAQRCRVQRDNWAYEGSACANGLAQGPGRARSRDRSTVYDGQFAQGQPVSGRLIVSGAPRFEGGFRNWTPEGSGICWYQGQPEECRMLNGERIDMLHKQREENARLQQQLRERERRDEEARLQRDIEEARRRRDREAEERRERRNERALAAGIASMQGGSSGLAASNDSLASTLRMQQQQSQIIAQGMADIQREQARREEARREQARREVTQQEAERPARQQAQQRLAAQQNQQAQNLEAARQQQQREAAAQRAREDEARRQQEARAAEARREAERQQRERDRQAEQQNKAKLEADYLKAIKDGTRMQAISCYGNHYVTGSRPRVKEPAHMGSCVDVAVTAWCPGDRVGRPVVATNFVGMGGCFGDIHKIEPKPACEAEQMRVVVEEVRVCR